MPDWQEQYINPEAKQTFDDWQGTYPQMQSGRQVSYKTVTPFAFAQEGTQNNRQTQSNTIQKQQTDAPTYQLGTLSSLMESNGGKKLWNNGNLDKTGGWSYGTYQIETKKGTMKDFLAHLRRKPAYQNYYNTLQQAGGYDAALIGSEQFKNAWRELSNDPDFLQSQQDYIVSSKLNPTIRYISDIKGLGLENRSPVVRDVLFSTAVQHGEGGARDIFHNALGYDASELSDEEIIKRIYQERSLPKQFKNSTELYRNNIINNRFKLENKKALELLKRYP